MFVINFNIIFMYFICYLIIMILFMQYFMHISIMLLRKGQNSGMIKAKIISFNDHIFNHVEQFSYSTKQFCSYHSSNKIEDITESNQQMIFPKQLQDIYVFHWPHMNSTPVQSRPHLSYPIHVTDVNILSLCHVTVLEWYKKKKAIHCADRI